MNMIKFNLIIIIVFILCGFESIFGCSCDAKVSPSAEYVRMDVAFSGKVINMVIDSSSTYPSKKVYIDVIESWKGDLTGTITIWTAFSEATCGYNFEINSSYLIYAYYWYDSLSTNLCTRTNLLRWASEDLEFLESLSAISKKVEIVPQTIILYQNYPNPFNPTTTISLSTPQSGHVDLYLYDIKGKFAETLFSGHITKGHHKMEFQAKNLASGVYFCALKIGSQTLVKKMILMR